MSDDGKQGRNAQQKTAVGHVKIKPREYNGGQSLAGVKNQGRYPECARFARHVGGANVAAAAGAHVLPFNDSYQQITKRDRAEQVAYGSGNKKLSHAHG